MEPNSPNQEHGFTHVPGWSEVRAWNKSRATAIAHGKAFKPLSQRLLPFLFPWTLRLSLSLNPWHPALWRMCSNWQNCIKSHLRLEPSPPWLKGDCCSCLCPTERSSHPSLPCHPPRAFRCSRGPLGARTWSRRNDLLALLDFCFYTLSTQGPADWLWKEKDELWISYLEVYPWKPGTDLCQLKVPIQVTTIKMGNQWFHWWFLNHLPCNFLNTKSRAW